MTKPILSICIPTFNRAQFLDNTIESIVNSDIFLNTDKVEIVLSDNCSEDNTQNICEKYVRKYGNKIKYIRHEKPISADVNIFKTIEYANGIYCKLNNDTRNWYSNEIEKAVQMLENNIDTDCILMTSGFVETENEITKCKTLQDIINNISIIITWVGCFCIKKDVYQSLKNPLRFAEKRFPLVDILGMLCEKDKTFIIYNRPIFNVVDPYIKKGGYNVAEAFGRDFLWILEQYTDKHNGICKKHFEMAKKFTLNHVNSYYFDYLGHSDFKRSGYFRYMLKYFKFDFYFYTKFIEKFLKYNIFEFKKDKTKCYLRVLGHLFLINKNIKKIWRNQNEHNKTNLVSEELVEYITVGNKTKGNINAIGDTRYNRGKLNIGNYVTICDDVKFYLTPSFETDTLSSYRPNEDIYNFKNITIKDDVWLGENVCIKAGVTINQGAVIEAGCTITEDIPPYAIVKNNQISGYRFSDDIIQKLLKIDFSKNVDLKTLSKTITSENINEINL